MNLNYPVGDFLIRLKNASMAHRKDVEFTATKLVASVANVLKSEGYLSKVEQKDGVLSVQLAYESKHPVLMDIKLKSKPGLRIYMDVKDIKAQKGASIFILSTSKGILSSTQAIKSGVGGEVIAEVW